MSSSVSFVEVTKDGILDYPIFPGQDLNRANSVWRVTADPQGPAVSAGAGFLHYQVSNQQAANQRVQVSISTPLPVKPAALLVFRVRAITIQGPEVDVALPCGIMLSFQNNGTVANWKWSDGTRTDTIAPSSIRPDGSWHDIILAFGASSGRVQLFEDGTYRSYGPLPAVDSVAPMFDMRVQGKGSNLSFDVGEIYAVPPLFAPGVNTPWDYSFKEGVAPSDLAMTFDGTDDEPQVSFAEGYVRFAGQSAATRDNTASFTVAQDARAVASVSFRIRVNTAAGGLTCVTLPGGNVLALTRNGQSASWTTEDGTSLAASSITAGRPDFTIVTLVMSPTAITLIEDGTYKYTRSYAITASWPLGLAVRQADPGGGVSVDVGGVRVLPSVKPPALLATDLQDSLLAYFSLKGTLENIAGTTGPLVPTNGAPAYIDGRFGKAASFAGGRTTLQIPQLPVVASPSYTLSAWVLVNGYPPANSLTGIAGPLLLDSTGHLQYSFIYNNQRSYQRQFFPSAGILSTGQWHNVAVTYSYEEARLAIFIDGRLDSVNYLGSETASASAIVPAYFGVGGYQADFSHQAVILNGAVGDLLVFSQHVHQPTAGMLADTGQADGDLVAPGLAILLVPLFLLVAAAVVRIEAEHQILEQIPQPDPPKPMSGYVEAIRNAVGVPAAPGKQVSRSDIGLNPRYGILLDIHGEGGVDLGGFVTGFKEAINVNAPRTERDARPPTVTVPGSLQGSPISNLVELRPWSTSPGFPFADNFADRLTVIQSEVTDKDVREIARVIRNGGIINLWVDQAAYGEQIKDLAARLNSTAKREEEVTTFQSNKDELRRAAPSTGAAGWPARRSIVARKPAVIFYATKFDDLKPLVASARDGYITHVLLGLFHTGYDDEKQKKGPYVHLNRENPDNVIFKDLWPAIKQVQAYGVRVIASLGGADVKDFGNFFQNESTYRSFYSLLRTTLQTYKLDGIDFDIEEQEAAVSTNNISRLVTDLRRDFRGFPRGFLISSAPVASALTGGRNISPNVNYVELFDLFDFYVMQFYNGFGQVNPKQPNNKVNNPTYADVAARYQDAHRLIAGVLTNPGDGAQGYNPIATLKPVLKDLRTKIRGFGGVSGWTYQNAVAGSTEVNPYLWAKEAALGAGIKPKPKSGDIAAITVSDSYPRVYYTDAARSVHQLAYSGSPANWDDKNISALASAAELDPQSTLTCCLAYGSSPQVYYAGRDTLHMHQLAADSTDPRAAWKDTDLTASIKVTPTLTGQAISAILGTSQNYPRVYYAAAADQHVHSYFYNGSWHEEDDTAIGHGPKYLPGTAVSSVNSGDDRPRVYYTGSDRHMHELAFSPGWADTDLTASTSTQAVPAAWAISSIIGTNQNYPRVYYLAVDWHIHSYFFNRPSETDNGRWYEEDDTALGKGPDAAADTSVSAVNVGGDQPRVYYVSIDRHVHELAFSGGWRDTDVTAAAHATTLGPPSGNLAATTVKGTGNRLPRVYYVAEDRRVHELWYDDDGYWHEHSLLP